MKTEIIHATSSPHAMPAETNNRRFSVFNDGIDATEVQERLDWKALRDMITIDTSILDFMPTGQHQVAALANLGAELVQEVKAYRPGFVWKSSPAEIVGALIEEMAPPTIEAKPQLAPGEREEFDAWFGDTSKRGYVHNEVSAFSGWLAAKRALAAAPVQPVSVPDGALLKRLTAHASIIVTNICGHAKAGNAMNGWLDDACTSAEILQAEIGRLAAPVQPVAVPDGWCQFIDDVKTQNVVRNEKELADLKEMMKVLGRPGVVEYRPFYFATPAAQADTKDAERYRWLTVVQGLRYSPPGGKAIADIGEMNVAIDAAVSAKKAGTI